jgi:hypothetical protein
MAFDGMYDFSAYSVKADCSSQLIRHIRVPSVLLSLLALLVQKYRHYRLRRGGPAAGAGKNIAESGTKVQRVTEKA